MTFVIPDMTMKHDVDKHTYKTLPMLFKFQSFLYKVFPNDLRIEFTIKPGIQYPTKVNVLSYFWNCISEGVWTQNYQLAVNLLKTKRAMF